MGVRKIETQHSMTNLVKFFFDDGLTPIAKIYRPFRAKTVHFSPERAT